MTKLESKSFIVADPDQPKPGDSNYEPLRSDSTKPKPATKRNREIVAFNIAVCMLKSFRYRDWMGRPDVRGVNGERINGNGEIYTPKFKKKR